AGRAEPGCGAVTRRLQKKRNKAQAERSGLLIWAKSRAGWPDDYFVFRLLGLAVLVEGGEVGPEIVGFGFVLDAGKGHLGAGNLGLRVLDVFEELILAPGDAGILVRVGITVVGRRSRLAAVNPVELGADLVLGAFADRVAGQALVER